jgi:hypothetical protein
MELQTAREIIGTLARGLDPATGAPMPGDSPYNAPPVIRALFTVSQALDGAAAARPRRSAPPNAGKAWSAQDDGQLQAGFAAGTELPQLAREMGRTRIAVEARLVKLGKLPARAGVPFSIPPAA